MYRLYIRRRTGNLIFLCTVRVPTLLDALRSTDCYRNRLQRGDTFRIRSVA